jgi:hypothetical protein
MKRDMDLVRKILLEIERQPFTHGKITLEIEGYSREEISYHVLLLSEANLIEAEVSARASAEYKPIRLTWQGHEFLESVRDEARWNKLKDIMGRVGGFVYEIARPVAIELLKSQVSLLLR